MIWEKGAVATILFLCSCSLNFMAQIISEPGTGKSIIKYVIYSTLPWSFISKPYSWYLSKTSLMLKQSRMVWGKRRKNETHLFNFFSYTFSGMFKPHVLPKELACMKVWTGSQMNCQSDLSTQKHRVFIL